MEKEGLEVQEQDGKRKKNIQKYYENTENALPHPMVKKFINMNNKPKYAIDLGCGAGRDTIYLISGSVKNSTATIIEDYKVN